MAKKPFADEIGGKNRQHQQKMGTHWEPIDEATTSRFDPNHVPEKITFDEMVSSAPLPNPDIKITLPDNEALITVIHNVYASWHPGMLNDEETIVNAEIFTEGDPLSSRVMYVQVFPEVPNADLTADQINQVVNQIIDNIESRSYPRIGHIARYDDVRVIETDDGPVYQAI